MAAQTDEFVLAGDGVLLKYQGKGGAVTIPDTVKVLSDAFFRCDTLTEVTLGKNVEVIGLVCLCLLHQPTGRPIQRFASCDWRLCVCLLRESAQH